MSDPALNNASTLDSQFTALATSLGASPSTTHKWSTTLLSHYTEPHRHYHTTAHISSMLQCLTHYHHLIASPAVLALAIFFHDIIYDPRRPDNELQSIHCFEAFARDASLDVETIARVSAYIERTITHTLPVSKPDDVAAPGADDDDEADLRLFLDFDLQVLGREEAEYARYAGQIREEYGHLGDKEYCAGRVKVLRGFLERERLFFSEVFYERFEEVARRNLEGEIVRLQGMSESLE